MKHKKLTFSLWHAALAAAVILGACSKDDPKEPQPDTPKEEPAPEPTPEPEPEPEPEPTYDDLGWEDATTAIANMGLGWNLGNTLDAHDYNNDHDGSDWHFWETYWGQPETTPELMQMLADAGFGAIRVPVTWSRHIDEQGNINEAWMNRVQQVVDFVMQTGMYCIINVHHDTGADDKAWLLASMKTYNAQKARFENIWRQIAERFAGYDHKLLFEAYNEMLDEDRSWCFASYNKYDAEKAADAYEAINSYAQSFVNVVRATGGNNVGRNLVVNTYAAACGSGTWNPHLSDPLTQMALPTDVVKNHLMFEVHSYPNIDNMSNARAEVDQTMDDLIEKLASKGAPVILGEWGHSSENPAEDKRIEFVEYFVNAAKAHKIGIFHWMGLTDGLARSLPAFNEPKVATAMLKAFHGSSYEPKVPAMNYAEILYTVTYNAQWSEANICNKTIDLNDYKAVRIRFTQKPEAEALTLKCYGTEQGVETYNTVNDQSAEITLDAAQLKGKASRITLQHRHAGQYSLTIEHAALVKADGTEEIMPISTFWGCTVSVALK